MGSLGLFPGSQGLAALDARATALRVKVPVARYYATLDTNLTAPNGVKDIVDSGRRVILSIGTKHWRPEFANLSWADVADGKVDAVYDGLGSVLAPIAGSIYCCPVNHEPEIEGPHHSGAGWTPADWCHAYNRAVTRLQAKAPGLKFGPIYSGYKDVEAAGLNSFTSPVHFRGVDPYNGYGAWAGTKWTWPDEEIMGRMKNIRAWSARDTLIPEIGCQEDPTDPGRKAAWLSMMVQFCLDHPRIKEVCYFDTTKIDSGQSKPYAWSLDTSSASTAVVRSMFARMP